MKKCEGCSTWVRVRWKWSLKTALTLFLSLLHLNILDESLTPTKLVKHVTDSETYDLTVDFPVTGKWTVPVIQCWIILTMLMFRRMWKNEVKWKNRSLIRRRRIKGKRRRRRSRSHINLSCALLCSTACLSFCLLPLCYSFLKLLLLLPSTTN